jgi:hypothetical protein
MRFRVGQLVTTSDRLAAEWEIVELFNVPGGVTVSDDVRVIGYLQHKDVALVVAVNRSDGTSVYVAGPHGGGWTASGMLRIVSESAQ